MNWDKIIDGTSKRVAEIWRYKDGSGFYALCVTRQDGWEQRQYVASSANVKALRKRLTDGFAGVFYMGEEA